MIERLANFSGGPFHLIYQFRAQPDFLPDNSFTGNSKKNVKPLVK